jgi:uncharacterized protein DUF4262
VSEDDDIDRSVFEHGWHAIAVEDHEPPFLYTIGLITQSNHPELIILGLERRTAYSVIADVVATIRAGADLDQLSFAFRPVHPSQHELYVGYAMSHARRHDTPLRVVQVLWPDKAGRFPTDGDCDLAVRTLQPPLQLAVTPSELRAFRREFSDD